MEVLLSVNTGEDLPPVILELCVSSNDGLALPGVFAALLKQGASGDMSNGI